ncbi:MAG TPA: glutathione S-transferase family protein [Gammaproteobacteria bacterium]|nr:glutathione S-transferase family protein [Gammaproteobacteria bacterium]
MLTLFHYEPYANSMKVMLCLKEKGLDFESRYIDLLKFDQHSSELVALNSNGQVPVLVHDGAVITESTMINEYLDDAFPELPLRPQSPVERAHMRIWSKLIDEVLMPTVSRLGWQYRFRAFAQSIGDDEFLQRMERVPLKEMREKWSTIHGRGFTEEQLDDARRQIRWVLDRLEERLAAKPWITSDDYSLADINTYPMVEGASRLYPDYCNERRLPRTFGWLRRISERPATREAYAMSRFGNQPGRVADAESRAV